MTTKDRSTSEHIGEEFDYGEYTIDQKLDKRFGDEQLVMFKAGQNKYGYQHFHGQELLVEKFIVSDETLTLNVVPIAPIHTPEIIADHVMLKFTTPLVL